MSELKKRFIDDTYVEYFNTGNHELAQIYLKSEADKVIAEYQETILVLEKSYKKLVKKFVHESSVAESYRSLIFKDDALKYKEEGNLEMYDELSKKSDKAYRHANRWRRIFRKLSQEAK